MKSRFLIGLAGMLEYISLPIGGEIEGWTREAPWRAYLEIKALRLRTREIMTSTKEKTRENFKVRELAGVAELAEFEPKWPNFGTLERDRISPLDEVNPLWGRSVVRGGGIRVSSPRSGGRATSWPAI